MDDLTESAGVREGDVLAGKYRIEKVLGVGGMGVVVAARHLQLETKVAIKFLLPAMLSNKEAVSRFAREARAAVKITGEHVARVLDVGTLDTGAPYMVMEFLEGGDLAAWITQRGALPVDQAVEFVLHAIVAVAEAHSLGIVHRDLKPANLFCIRRADGKNSIKVLDFGISKVTDPSGSESGMSVTKTSAMMGSPLYMSPEQMRSPKEVDAQTDVWALGVILFELLTTQVPFDGETVPEVAIKVATQAPPALSGFRKDVPLALERVIIKALEKGKAERFKNVAELAVALGEFAPPRAKPLVERICGILNVVRPESLPPQAWEPPPPQSPTVAAATMTSMGRTTDGVGASATKKRAAFAVLGVVGVIGAAAIAVTVLHKKPADDLSAASPSTLTATPIPSSVPTSTLTPVPVPTLTPPAQGSAAQLAVLPPDLPAPGRKPQAGHAPAPHPAAAPPPAPAPAPPPAAPAPAPTPHPSAPAQHKNQLDLGNFQ
jgi:serine/threonine protein kinase